MEAKLLPFLERLLGESVDANDTITVSSIQRARLVAWLNENSIPASLNHLRSNLIRIPDLLTGAIFAEQDPGQSAPPTSVPQPPDSATGEDPFGPTRYAAPVLGIGIDIQARSSMPEAADLRADRFYAANFAPGELAHCIQQGDPRLSLAGLWAAKEAIVKAGAAAPDKNGGLAVIEILHDNDGSPQYPRCLISISHDQGLAVGVCIRMA